MDGFSGRSGVLMDGKDWSMGRRRRNLIYTTVHEARRCDHSQKSGLNGASSSGL